MKLGRTFGFLHEAGRDTEIEDLGWTGPNPYRSSVLKSGAEAGSVEVADASGVIKGTIDHDTIVGTEADDDIRGREGDDNLDGGEGDDILDGGRGDDNLSGGSGNDVLSGRDGNDVLVGDAGDDALLGGYGIDTLYGDGAPRMAPPGFFTDGDGLVTKPAGLGNVSLATALDISNEFHFAANPDIADSAFTPHVTIKGAGDDSKDYYKIELTAGTTITLDMDNIPYEFDSFVTIFNAEGLILAYNDDSFYDPGTIDDFDSFLTYTVETSGVFYIEVRQYFDEYIPVGAGYNLNVSVSVPSLADFEAGDDVLEGGVGDDVLYGGLGDDILNGGLDDNRLDGGDGRDTASFAQSLGGVVASLAAGYSSRSGGYDILVSIEVLIGSDFNDSLRGDTKSNSLQGGLGADTLSGGDGDDVLSAGLAGQGSDDADRLFGGAGADGLYGGLYTVFDGGADYDIATVWAGSTSGPIDFAYGEWANGKVYEIFVDGVAAGSVRGIEALTFHAGEFDDRIAGGLGSDTLLGNGGADRLKGNEGDDVLDGGAGRDRLQGDLGQDTLIGGTGADVFLFRTLQDSQLGGADLITDLSDDDRIDLSAIDADTTLDGDQAFQLGAGGAAGDMTITYDAANDRTVINLYVDDNDSIDGQIWLSGDQTGRLAATPPTGVAEGGAGDWPLLV